MILLKSLTGVEVFDLKPEQVLSSVKQPQRVKARSLLCYVAVKELEMRGTDVAGRLKISKFAVCPTCPSRNLKQSPPFETCFV